MDLIQNQFDFMAFGPDECVFVYIHFRVCVARTEILTLSCPLIPIEKVKGSTVLNPWITLHTLLIPSGELSRNSAEADQNPKSLGGSGVDRKMERQVSRWLAHSP